MTVSLDITESIALTVVRSFLLTIVPSGVEVIQFQMNQVPEPVGPDFVMMSHVSRVRLATNKDIYAYVGVSPTTAGAMTATQMIVQLDVHGPNSCDNAQMISTLWRDAFGSMSFAASGYSMGPLYCGDPMQAPFVNAENLYENRWTMDAVLQVNPIVTFPQAYAAALKPTIVGVEETYH